jgi:uncharacterized protein YbaP (TraB family)
MRRLPDQAMLRRLVTAVLICVLALGPAATRAQAAGADNDSPATPAQGAPKRGFFWEARKGEQKIYLLGTVHVGRPDFYPPNVDYLRRFQEAAGIVVEADVFDAARVGRIVARMALYPDGQPGLDTRVDARLRARIEAQVRRFGIDPARAWRMKPWMLANTLVILQAAESGFSPAYSTESFLFQFATSTGKPLLEIESIEKQLSIFERASEATQVAYLEQALRGVESGDAEREVRKIVDAWSRRDAAEGEQLIGEIRKGSGPGERFVAEQLFDARHPAMVAAIERFAATGKVYLVAVGALHYFGPGGLLAALRSRGFAIAPVP